MQAGPVFVLDASFWSRALATLVGTVAGFLFSIVLFYVSESVKQSRGRKRIVDGLKREAAFNLSLCDSWLVAFSDMRPKIAAGDTSFLHYIDYSRILSIFVGEALKAGILYELLTDDSLVALDKWLRYFQGHSEREINSQIEQWKAGSISPLELSQALTFNEFAVKEGQKIMKTLSQVAARPRR
jgi:hypothetical protein